MKKTAETVIVVKSLRTKVEESNLIKNLSTIDEFENMIKEHSGIVFYFSTPSCNVCKVLKPKIIELLSESFPKMKFAYINCEDVIELSAQMQIFSVPTILFYFDGKEFLRKSRLISIQEVKQLLERPYTLLYD